MACVLAQVLAYKLCHLKHGDYSLTPKYTLEVVVSINVPFVLSVLQLVFLDISPLSKAELARKAGVSVLTISRIELGMECRMDTKRKVIQALGLKTSEKERVFPE